MIILFRYVPAIPSCRLIEMITRKNDFMKRFPIITSAVAQIKFLEQRVENYFNRKSSDNEVFQENFSQDFENIAFRSLHTMGQGSVEVVFASDKSNLILEIPTNTYFLVTGIKTLHEQYRLTFAASMS